MWKWSLPPSENDHHRPPVMCSGLKQNERLMTPVLFSKPLWEIIDSVRHLMSSWVAWTLSTTTMLVEPISRCQVNQVLIPSSDKFGACQKMAKSSKHMNLSNYRLYGHNWIGVLFFLGASADRGLQLWRDLIWQPRTPCKPHTIRVVVYFNDCIPKLRCQTYGFIIWLETAHSMLVLAGTKAATV